MGSALGANQCFGLLQTGSEMEIALLSANPALAVLFSIERIRHTISNRQTVETDEASRAPYFTNG